MYLKDSNLKLDLLIRDGLHFLNGAKKNNNNKKKNEECTAKGNNVGSINLNFMVGISYNNGVVSCEHYKNAITSQKMEQIKRNAIPEV